MDEHRAKDNWDKLRAAAPFAASVLVPLVVLFVGNNFTKSMKEAENRLKYVELAVSILRSEPKEENASLRSWAVDVLQQQAIVPLSAEAQTQLKSQKLSTYTGGWDTGSGGNWSTTYPVYSPKQSEATER